MKNKPITLKQENTVVNLLLLVVYVIALYPLTKIGLTIGDDMDLFLNCCPTHWQFVVGNFPTTQGRFYLYFMRWVYALPYLVDSPLYFYSVYILPIALCFIAFNYFVRKLFNNNSITLFSSLLLIATMQIALCSATTAYPFYFTFSFSLILISLSLLLLYYEKEKKYLMVLSFLIMFLSTLFYEAYMIYYILFLILFIWKRKLFNGFEKAKLMLAIKDIIPFFICGLIYLIVYFSYRYFYPPHYPGLHPVDNWSISGLMRTMFRLSSYAFPLQTYHDFKYIITTPFFSSTNILFFVNGLLIASLSYYALSKYKKIKSKYLISALFIGALFVFLPQLFVSISQKFYLAGLKNYIPSFFTFFSFTIFLLSILFLLYNLSIKNKALRIAFKIIISLLILYTSILTQITNNTIANDFHLSKQRFDIVDKAIAENAIPNIEDQVICFENAHNTSSKIIKMVSHQGFSWNQYIFRISGKNVKAYERYNDFYKDYSNTDKLVWVTCLDQTKKADQPVLYFALLRGKDLPKNKIDIDCNKLIKVTQEGKPRLIESKAEINSINLKQIYITQRQERVKDLVEQMKNTSYWYKTIKQKAKDNKISIEQQLQGDANWMLEQEN